MQYPTITAEKRAETGSSAAARYRAGGKVPAVIMRPGEDSLHILLDEDAANHVLVGEHHCIAVTLGKRKYISMIKAVDRHCLTDRLQHLDLLAVTEDSSIKVEVPVHPLTDDCPGIKAGGLLEQMLRQVRVQCAVKDIPDHVDVDLGEAQIGTTIYAEDVRVPAGIKLLNPPRTALMSVIKTRSLKKAEAEDEVIAEGEEGAEGAAAVPAEGEAPAEPAT